LLIIDGYCERRLCIGTSPDRAGILFCLGTQAEKIKAKAGIAPKKSHDWFDLFDKNGVAQKPPLH
jgi:hypothetical protein